MHVNFTIYLIKRLKCMIKKIYVYYRQCSGIQRIWLWRAEMPISSSQTRNLEFGSALTKNWNIVTLVFLKNCQLPQIAYVLNLDRNKDSIMTVFKNKNYFKLNSEIYSINTSNKSNLHQPLSHLTAYRKGTHCSELRCSIAEQHR